VRGAHGDWHIGGVASGLELTTKHGDVEALVDRGPVELRVGHGDLVFELRDWDSQTARLNARCEHGNALLRLPPEAWGSARTLHGDLDVWMPESATTAVVAEATHGDVHSDVSVHSFYDGPDRALELEATHGSVRIRSAAAY
jgi:hypothetical protein